MSSRHELSRDRRHQPKRLGPRGESRTGWRRRGILVIAEHDPRLTLPERELIRQLGVKLYEERCEGGR
jgi:hypothetical protein